MVSPRRRGGLRKGAVWPRAMYARGEGVPQDYAEALTWYRTHPGSIVASQCYDTIGSCPKLPSRLGSSVVEWPQEGLGSP